MSTIGKRVSRTVGLAAVLCTLATAAPADDGRGLRRGGDPSRISLSGLSSGAAMAVQYAVAHSGSVEAVGSVAGPQWGCAEASLSRAVNACLCGRSALTPTIETARRLAAAAAIDSLVSDRPQTLNRSWVFQGPADETVTAGLGRAGAAFLSKQDRALDTRRKVLLGALVLQRLEAGHDPAFTQRLTDWLRRELPGFLTREADKALFADLIGSETIPEMASVRVEPAAISQPSGKASEAA